MHERELRAILLIQAIEETDRDGEVLPRADRLQATREMVGTRSLPVEGSQTLSSATELLLARRAALLLEKLRPRVPGLDHVLSIARGSSWLDRGMPVMGFCVGLALSMLNGNHRIDLFAWPLLALVVWNVLIYVVLIGRVIGARAAAPRLPFWFGNIYARSARRRLDALVEHSTRFNAPLAPGLRRFAADWGTMVGQPLFIVRARRVLHWSAILTAAGLIVGFYLQAWLLRYPAGWWSFLGPRAAEVWLSLLYGPACALSGVTLPGSDALAALRFNVPPGTGGDATVWVKLIAWTAVLYIVLPRLLAVALTTLRLLRLARRLAVPAGLASYFRMLMESARTGI